MPTRWLGPLGRARTQRPRRAKFKTSFAKARDELIREITLLGGTQPVLSTNIALRRDGLPYAGTAEPDDPGIAVYFVYKGQQRCFANDQWDRVRDNIQGARKTIEALRGISRWGTGDMMDRAFDGFAELPSPEAAGGTYWYDVLGCEPTDSLEVAKLAYRRAMSKAHPDRPEGSKELSFRVQKAWEQAQQLLS